MKLLYKHTCALIKRQKKCQEGVTVKVYLCTEIQALFCYERCSVRHKWIRCGRRLFHLAICCLSNFLTEFWVREEHRDVAIWKYHVSLQWDRRRFLGPSAQDKTTCPTLSDLGVSLTAVALSLCSLGRKQPGLIPTPNEEHHMTQRSYECDINFVPTWAVSQDTCHSWQSPFNGQFGEFGSQAGTTDLLVITVSVL